MYRTTQLVTKVGLGLAVASLSLACEKTNPGEAELAQSEPDTTEEGWTQVKPDPPAQQPGQAEPGQAMPPGTPGAAAAAKVSDAQLDEYAGAYQEVVGIREQLQEDLASVESQEQAQALQQKAVSDIQKRVEKSGMEWTTYTVISQQLAEDPALQARFVKKIEDLQASR